MSFSRSVSRSGSAKGVSSVATAFVFAELPAIAVCELRLAHRAGLPCRALRTCRTLRPLRPRFTLRSQPARRTRRTGGHLVDQLLERSELRPEHHHLRFIEAQACIEAV